MALSKIDVANMLTGATPVANGGTAATTLAAAGLQRPNAKPLMINGDMAVAQYGTSNTNYSNATLVVDRMKGVANGLGSSGSVLTGSQVSDGPTGFEKAFKLEVTSAGGLDSADNRFAIETKFEHQDVSKFFDNNAMTLSFYVKSSLADTFAVGIARNNQNTSSGGNLYIANYTISSANTWQQVVINIPTDSTTTGETANATGVSLQWFIDIKSGGSRTGASLGWNDTTTAVQINSAAADNGFFNATNTWFITGVQLEVGTFTSSTLPAFQHESFEENLARCQRYFVRYANENQALGTFSYYSSSRVEAGVSFPVTMRTSPSLVVTSGSGYHRVQRANGDNNLNDFTIGNTGTTTCTLFNTDEASGTAGHAGLGYTRGSGFVSFDAEL